MPYSVNGFGTMVCGARGHLSWTKKGWLDATDYDGVECISAALLPVIPYRPVHIYGKSSQGAGYQYQYVPIRWSLGLVFRAFLARWLWVPFLAALIYFIVKIVDHVDKGWQLAPHEPVELAIASVVLLFPICVWWLLRKFDRRNRDLRRVMGPVYLGSSDPVHWKEEHLAQISSPSELYETSTFEQAASRLLSNGEYARAMFAARMCAAVEDRLQGERMTNEILADDVVRERLPQVHLAPLTWAAAFGKGLVQEQDEAANSSGNRSLNEDWDVV